MKKYLLALLAALGLASVGFAAETVFGDSPVAVWRDFHNLTSGGYTLNKDDACTVNEDGSIILGGQGLSLTGLDLENASVLLEVSSIPTSSGSLVSYFVSSGENDQYVTLFKNGTNYYFGDNATTGGGEDASCGTLTLTSNPFMFNHSKVDGTAMLYNPSDTDDKYTRAPLHWSTHNIKSIYIGSYDGVTTEGVKAPLAGLTIKAIYLYSNYYNNSWPTKMNLVAECNGLPYSSLSDALDAVADGGTITLLQDVVLASSLALPNLTLTLDLGGKILSVEGVQTSGVPAIKVDNGTITLKNGTVKGNSPAATYSGSAAVLVSGACTLNLEGVTLVGGDSIDAGMGSALQFNNQAKNAVVTINNSTLQGGTTTASEGEAIKGGSGNAIEMHADVASSVSIAMTGENTLWASEYAAPYSTATACVVYNTGNASSDAHALVAIAASGTINVTGGLLHNVDLSTTSEVVIKVAEPGAISDNMDYVVNGKNAYTITDEGTTVTVAALTAETAEAEINGIFYRSFIGAVNAAAEGETITLRKEVTVTSSYTLKKGVTVEGTVSGVAASVANTRYNTTTYYTTFTEAAAALGSSWTSTLVMLADYTATDNIAIGDISGAGVVAIDTNEQTLTLGDYIFYSGSVEANKAPVQAYDTGTKCWYIGGESKLPDLFKKELTGDVSVQLNGDVYMTASTVLAGENVTIDLNGHEISNASSDSWAMAHAAGLPLFKVGESRLTITDSEGTGSLAQYEGSVFTGGITSVESPTLDNCFTGIVEGVGSVSITGGSYPVDPTPYLAAGYNTSTEDGKITVGKFAAKIGDKGYVSLEAALDAATDGQILKLLADVTTTAENVPTYAGTGTVTIDVNGHTLTSTIGLEGGNILFTGGFGWYMYRNSNYQATDKFIVTPELETCLELAAETKKGNQPSVIELYDDWTVPYDITLPSTHTTSYFAVAEGYDITVDLNGKTVTQEPCQGQPSGGSFTVYGGRLTIVDNSAEQSGKVIGTYSTGYPSGTTIYQSGLAAYCISGELILKGGTFTAEKALEGATKDEGVVRAELPGAKIVLDGAKVLGVNDYAVKNWGEFVFESGIITVEDATETKSILVGDGGTATLNKAPESGLVEIVESSVSTTVNVAGVQYAGKEPLVGEGLETAGDWVVEEGMAVMIAGEPNTFYPTLAEAIAAAKDGETVTLLKSSSGSGIIVPEGTYTTGLTVDFNGKTYTVNEEPLAGSTGTQTQGFQLLKDNNITFKNGKIRATNPEVKMLVQNYSNLTLEGMTLDGTPSAYSTNNIQYVLSNNNGNTVLTGGTTITATDEQIAFDVCRYASYPSVAVTVADATISGTIEVSGNVADAQSATLTLTKDANLSAATLKIANNSLGAVVTKDAAATMGAPAGFDWVAQDDGSQKLTKLDVSESFTVKPNIEIGGEVGKGTLGNDGLISITAKPAEGYAFVGWSGPNDYVALDANTNVTITVDNQTANLIAHFVPTATYTTVTNDLSQTTLGRADLVKWDDILDLSLQNPSIELTVDTDNTPVVFAGIQVMKLSGVAEDGTPQWELVTDATVHSYTEEKIKLQLPTKSNTRFLRVIDHK